MGRTRFIVGALVLLVALTAVFYFLAPIWLWHPLGYCPGTLGHVAQVDCKGYNSWSGILGSVAVSIPQWLIALTIYARHNNCFIKGCWNRGHKHPKHGRPVCDDHFHIPHPVEKHLA